ncbi:MAG: type IV pilus twitching motility protein PilT [SAR202 cluster bacterium]|jgi:twitching motility protein PilT|nr:type IV pilus twitching motility protein PilT [SAR202 cluster bacterium]MDP6513142.1 type IV pilus twitching motility protein PilT [SAR202 cluster bacterium]MDP6716772.1 type IV pilus twitching motility protein PilT [SAR202 cluster bacterium]
MAVDLNEILRAAVGLGASDVHLSVGTPPSARVSGELESLDGFGPITGDDAQAAFKEMVHDPDAREKFINDWELDFAYEAPGLTRFRGNACIQRGTIKLSLRALASETPTIEALDLPPVIRQMAGQTKGLLLVCGPTGSGKSTTLAAMVQHINLYHRRVIVTVEDPIEFVYQDAQSIVIQREVGLDTRDINSALRHALRQDPDVILVGEMRDLETISLAVTAAETGHLVLSTIHANSSTEAIDRIVDAFPPGQQNQVRSQLAMSLAGVIYQTLVPRLDDKGRVAVCEVLVGTNAVRNLVRQARTFEIPSYLQTGRQDGMQTLQQALEDLKRRFIVRADEELDNPAAFDDPPGAGSDDPSSILPMDSPFDNRY